MMLNHVKFVLQIFLPVLQIFLPRVFFRLEVEKVITVFFVEFHGFRPRFY